jgi:ribonuclease BN (tRNA processing enzyme)
MASPRIHFLGTGNAFNTDGRGSPSVGVEPAGGPASLVDIGPTTLAAMQRQGVDPAGFDRLFVTHLHGDHIAGWPFLLLHLVLRLRRSRPFDVFGPPGTRDCLESLARLCWGELVERQGFPLRYHEHGVQPARGLDAGAGLTFDLYPMRHHESSVGYLLRFDGQRLGISGDTAWCPSLERLAAACDSLVLECSSVERQPVAHISLDELREGRERLEARRVFLVHLTDEVARALARDPIAGVDATHDGLTVVPG